MSSQTEKAMKIVVIGGVAGGASAAARARRLNEHADILMVERGPDVSFANCGLPYHIGGEIQDRSLLALQTPQSLKGLLNITVENLCEATSINRKNQTVTLHRLESGEIREEPYDKLILAPGASPLKPPLKGIDDPRVMTLRNLVDMDQIKKRLSQNVQRVTVIGAGFIGLEMAEQLVHLGKKVTLIERLPQVLPQLDEEMTQPIAHSLKTHGVELIINNGVQDFITEDENEIRTRLANGREVSGELVILSIGVKPDSELARDAELELGERGHIRVNEFMQTSDPDIYAAGDAVETIDPLAGGYMCCPLGGPANRQGRVIADHLFLGDRARPYPGSIGTAIVRVFSQAAGVTGLTEKRADQLGLDTECTVITDLHHAGYYPGAVPLSVKIIWNREDGRLLGGQAAGIEGVDKRLDVLATAIRGNLTVDDLVHLELAYAPPFGSAKDPINTAGFTALNQRNGLVRPIYEIPDSSEYQVVDLRPAASAQQLPVAVEGAINIPLAELRGRLNQLDRNRPVATVCAVGKSSYFGARILAQHGFNVVNIVGGLKIRDS